jgi:PAS domain S-box-containing protein
MEAPEMVLMTQGINPAVKYSLRVLIVEDNPDDAAICQRLLRKTYSDARCEVVQTPEAFARQIRSTYYDVILADYALGSWTGIDAFNLTREAGRDIPFILVTGVLNDAQAIECVQSGITDYILKDHPERLPLAISRALEEKELLKEHKRAELALKESEAKFRALADAISAATFVEQGSQCCYANRPAEWMTGYDRDELAKMSFWNIVIPESRKSVFEKLTQRLDEHNVASRYELRIITKQRDPRWLDVTVGLFQLEGRLGTLITAFDISERKRQEKEILNLDPSQFSLVELPLLRCYQ